MKWLVVGAGAIGGYFGGRLLEAGRDLTFLVHARRQAQLAASGLVLRSPLGDFQAGQPQAVLAQDVRQHFDVILVTCKAYDLAAAMDDFAPAVGPDTAILPLLNGMRHVDALAQRFGAEHVLGGMCVISAALDAEGAIHHLNRVHRLVWGELEGTHSPRASAIDRAFQGLRCDVQRTDGVRQEMWEKWVLIATVAGSTCLMRAAICDIVGSGGRALITGIYEECSAIAAANGFAPRPQARARMLAFATKADSDMTASMEKDMERGARIEGEHIIGALIARAGAERERLRLLPVVDAHLRAYAARRAREHAGA